MASYSDFVGQVIGEPVAASGTDILTTHISNYMIEGAQVVINAMPKEMLWAMEVNDDFVDASSNPEGVAVGSNKILQVVRESDAPLISSINGCAGFTSVTHTPTTSWTGSQEWSNISQKSTTGSGSGVRLSINTNSSGNIEDTFILIEGVGYTDAGGSNSIVIAAPDGVGSDVTYTINVVSSSSESLANVECREIPAALIGRATVGSGWQEEASETDPVYYKLGGKVNIIPTSIKSNSKVYWVKVPPEAWETDAQNSTYMAGTILTEIEPLIMLYVLKKVYGQKLALAQFGTVTQGSSLETYIADEDLEMAQGQQLLIQDLQAMLLNLEKEFQMGIQLLMQGTYKPELLENAQTQDTYAKLQGKRS
tara:strand:+ start:670 stop:1767 length:1098 start_codon:yes stop_codon:yes gene_type:complete